MTSAVVLRPFGVTLVFFAVVYRLIIVIQSLSVALLLQCGGFVSYWVSVGLKSSLCVSFQMKHLELGPEQMRDNTGHGDNYNPKPKV